MKELLLQSWDRQSGMMSRIASLVTPELSQARPSPKSWTLQTHLAHVHEVRFGWIGETLPARQKGLLFPFVEVEGGWEPIDDLDEIKRQLELSALAVRGVVDDTWDQAVPIGPYSHPLFFLQHMIWHEGWHAGLILNALREAGAEPSEEWEEEHIWGVWRS